MVHHSVGAISSWDDLVDRLAVYDVHYLTGGSVWDGRAPPYHSRADVPPQALVTDLARADEGRMRDALVALLFRHPELAPGALAAADQAKDVARTRLLIRASVLAAAALRTWWGFVLNIYLPGQPPIDADDIARAQGVPSPRSEYGRPCLAALAEQLRAGQPFPFAYERGWQLAADHILEELRAAARKRSA
jgi:hypothetical protein